MEFAYNIPLEALERSQAYKQYEVTLRKALYHQWEDIVTSGLLNEVEEYIKNKHLPARLKDASFKKAVSKEPALPSGEDEKVVPLKYAATLLTAIQAFIKKRIKPLRQYFDLRAKTIDFLTYTANKSGQQILDQVSDFTDTRPKVFHLEETQEKKKIVERAETLLNELDAFTIVVIARTAKKLFEQGLTKQKIIKELLKKGEVVAEQRAKRIAQTELVAIHNYIRTKVAKLSGIEMKEWYTVGDDRTCPTCARNNQAVVKIDDQFPTGHSYPPAHIHCRCSLSFHISDTELGIDQFNEPMLSKSFDEVLDTLVQKKLYTFYNNTVEGKVFPIVNPEALWTGGNGLIGKDKHVGELASRLQWNNAAKVLVEQDAYHISPIDKRAREYASQYQELGSLLFSKPDKYLSSLNATERVLLEARLTLTDVGFLQLLKSKGYTGKVSLFHIKALPYPKKPYTDIIRRHAQNQVKSLVDKGGNIKLSDLNISVVPTPKGATTTKVETYIPLEQIDFSKPILNAQRIISIMDNFEESQRRGGKSVELYQLPNGRYTIGGDGNHRLYAARQLGYEKIYAKVLQMKD